MPLALSAEWVAAIFGIVGTVVGATVTGAVDFLMELKRERALIRQAKRMVAVELDESAIQMQLVIEEK